MLPLLWCIVSHSSDLKMKNGVFSKARPNLSAAKANVECYINCNVPELDRVESEEPLWLESYGEDDEVVPDSDTVVVQVTADA